MKRALLLLSIFLPILVLADPGDSLRVIEILRGIQTRNASHAIVKYTGNRTIISHGMDDSISKGVSTVWIETRRQDPYFGARFHLQGNDGRENLDYYYDGQRAYEYRHGSRGLYVVDPAGFPNNENNPAKARTALRALELAFIDTALAAKYMKGNPAVSVKEESGNYLLGSLYPDTKELKRRKWMLVKKDDLQILEMGLVVDFNGSVQTNIFRTESVSFNNSADLDSVYLREPAGHYTLTEKLRPATAKPSDIVDLSGRMASDFSFISLAGKMEKLSAYRGKYVLLDFWESWCGYCIQSIPKKDSLYQAMAGKGLVILGITTENRNQVKNLAERNKVSYPTLLADATVTGTYKVTARPTYVLVGPDGRIIKNGEGNLDEMMEEIRERI